MNDTAPLSRLIEIVGERNALRTPEDTAPYLREWRDLYVGKTPMVLRPGSREEVAAILAHADAHGLKIVPQGGNTGPPTCGTGGTAGVTMGQTCMSPTLAQGFPITRPPLQLVYRATGFDRSPLGLYQAHGQ